MGYASQFQLIEGDPTKENAATSAKVNGVKIAYEVSKLPEMYITAFPILAMHWGALV